jgi:hypothetical protein
MQIGKESAPAGPLRAAKNAGFSLDRRISYCFQLLYTLPRSEPATRFLVLSSAKSPIPHLDWEQLIQSGIKEAKAALSGGSAKAASAP